MINTLLATATTTPVPLTDVLSSAGSTVTSMLGWVTDVGNAVVNNGILFLGVSIFVLGGVIAIFGRLLSRN